MTLEQLTKYAQAEANRQQRAMTIWNLNRYNPLYVCRDAKPGDSERNQFVATIQPVIDLTEELKELQEAFAQIDLEAK